MKMQENRRYQVAKKATLVNSVTNAVLACLKIILGLLGHSQALVADGIHSFSDLITDALVLVASKVGTQEPDQDHPYGHQRIETLATIVVAIILMGVAIGIAYETLHHILSHQQTPKPEFIVIVVALFSVFANEFLYHYTMRLGNQVDSDLLRSNAWHSRSDSLVSLIVLISVIGAMLGAHYLDAIGAFVIAILILKMAIKMIYKNIRELIDTGASEKLIAKITSYIEKNPDVISIHQLRTRSHGGNIFLDVHIEVNPMISVSEGHYIGEQVTLGLIQRFKKITDVTVHIDPEDDGLFILSKDLPNRQSIETDLQQCWKSFDYSALTSKIILHYLNGKVVIEIYLPTSKNNTKHLIEQYKKAVSDLPYLEKIKFYVTAQP